jgi:O-antigen/teichoic acid export membrane protein
MSVKRNIAYNTILRVANVAFPIITTPYVSRVLGVENIGAVNFASTYASYFALVAALGIPVYGVREIAKLNDNTDERNKVFSELFAVSGISTVICALIYIVTVFAVPVLYQERRLLLITGIAIFALPFSVDWFFSGREKFKIITIRALIVRIVSLAGLFIFVRTRADVVPYLLLTVFANVASQFWNFGYMLKTEVTIRLQKLNLRKHLKGVMTLFASNIAISVYTMLSAIILGFMSNYTEVGYYTSAIKISNMILPIVTAMSPVVIARINTLKGSQGNNRNEIIRLLSNSFEYMMMLAIPASIGLIVIAPRFVPLFFGAEFIPSTLPLQLLSLLIIIIGISNLFGWQVLVAMGYEKKFLVAVLIGTVSSFILNLLLDGKFGAMGATTASIIAEIFVTIATIAFAYKILPVKIKLKNIYQPMVACFPVVVIGIICNNLIINNLIHILTTIILGGLVYGSIMICTFKNEQMNNILSSVIKRFR